MAKKVFLLLITWLIFLPMAVQAEDRIYFEASAGYYRLPGFLFSLDKSVTKHPDNFNGFYQEFGFNYALNKRWAVGLSFVNSGSDGDGQWLRSSTAEEFRQNGVDGIVSGHTKIENRGLIFNLKRSFREDHAFRPYFKAGGGLGRLKVKFDGQFIGHETESGFDLPVLEDASDRVSHLIPLLNFEVGLEYQLGPHFYLYTAPYWNTGFGWKLGTGINF